MGIPVLLMSHSLGQGGSERQLAGVALGLGGLGFEPHICSVERGFRYDELRWAGIPAYDLPLRSFLNTTVVEAALGLRRYARANGIRLIHAFDYSMSAFGVPAGRTIAGMTVVSSQRCHMELIPGKYRGVVRAAHRLAHSVVVNCETLRRHMAGEGVDPAKIRVCYNGLDTGVFHAGARSRIEELRNAELVIGVVCALRPEKNLGALVEAFAALRRERAGLRLLIAGSGSEEAGLRRRAEELGAAQAVVFHPSSPEVARLMGSIDVFAHPSLSEGLPNAVMEAMARGCCVVATDAGGTGEIVDHGRTGLLCGAGSVESLRGALAEAIGDEALRSRLAEAGAARMREFSMERSVESVAQVYSELLERRAAAPAVT
jgi:L-malate glycosyltransferase